MNHSTHGVHNRYVPDDFVIVWKDPPDHSGKKRVGKARQTEHWANAAWRMLRRQPGRTGLLRTFKSPAQAWACRDRLEDRGLMPGVELIATKSEDGIGSELYGRYEG